MINKLDGKALYEQVVSLACVLTYPYFLPLHVSTSLLAGTRTYPFLLSGMRRE